jgi:predicted nucleotidyltransferase
MLTQKQLTIFQVFTRNPFAAYTLKQIKRLSKEKSNNALSIAMKQFKKESLLKEQKVGKSSLYTLNLDNDLVYYYIALANHSRLNSLVHKTIKIIKENVEKYTKFYSIVIFGSYATQEQKKESDFDVAVFIEAEELRKEINKALRSAALKSVLNIDGHAITKDEFLEMLKLDEENLGKQIARKHRVVYNHQIFYAILQEGIKHGFRI